LAESSCRREYLSVAGLSWALGRWCFKGREAVVGVGASVLENIPDGAGRYDLDRVYG
jgi:hypothetical protein